MQRLLNLLQAGPPQSWFIAVGAMFIAVGAPSFAFFYRSLQVGDVNVRPEPALPCKDPQLLAQCLINIASNHPRFVRDCGISF